MASVTTELAPADRAAASAVDDAATPGARVVAKPIDPPRWAFPKGATVGALVVLPMVALAVWAMARLGLGAPDLGLVQAARTAAIFAGVATILSAGGIGRLAAEASAAAGGNLGRAMWIGARTQALASAGLVVIAALPHGHVPGDPWRRALLGLAGATSGAIAGVVIGLACGAAKPVALADVMALARWPQEAIRRAMVSEDDTPLPQAPIEVSRTVRAATERPLIERDPTPLPVPVPLGETRPVAAMPAPARVPTAIEPHEPTPLPRPLPLGETAPIMVIADAPAGDALAAQLMVAGAKADGTDGTDGAKADSTGDATRDGRDEGARGER